MKIYLWMIILFTLSFSAKAGLPPNKVTGQTYIQKNGVNSINISQVPLTSGVTGILPYANGGTNATTSWTLGSVLFAGSSSIIQDNAKLFWDDSLFQFGIGTATPAANLNIVGTATTETNILVNEIASQTGDILDAFDSAANILLAIKSDGSVGIHKLSPAAMLEVDTKSTTQPNVIIKAIASQTIGMLQLKDPSNVVLDNFLPSGNAGIVGTASAASGLTIAIPTALPSTSNGLSLSQTGVVAPASVNLESLIFSTDTTAYATSGTVNGIVTSISNSKLQTGTILASSNLNGLNLTTNQTPTQASINSTAVNLNGILNVVNNDETVSGTSTTSTYTTTAATNAINNNIIHSSSGSNTVTEIGDNIVINDSPENASAGTITQTDYGARSTITSINNAHLSTTAYGFWAGVSGAGTNWDFYGSTGKSYFKGPIGINQVSPVAELDIINSAVGTKGLTVKGIASQTADFFELNNSSGTTLFGVNASGFTSLPHIIGNTAAPTVVVGTGAGTGATTSVIGTDLAGTITVVAGTLPTASAVISTLTFNKAYASAPFCVFSASNSNAGLASLSVYETSTATTMVLNATTSALTAALTFTWNYNCAQ